MTAEFHQFKLRIPVDLMRRIESQADSSGRSTSAEMVWRLEKSFDSRLTYDLLDRRFLEADVLNEQFVAGEARLAVLREQLEAAVKAKDEARIAEISAQTMRLAADMRTTARQAKRVQEEIEALTSDLNERARSVLPLSDE
ncbi:TPA: Arc family DNA-binding protein [Stenotrophomonas maltophilia]